MKSREIVENYFDDAILVDELWQGFEDKHPDAAARLDEVFEKIIVSQYYKTRGYTKQIIDDLLMEEFANLHPIAILSWCTNEILQERLKNFRYKQK